MNILIVTRDAKDGIGTTVKNLIIQYNNIDSIKKITVITPKSFDVESHKIKYILIPVIGKFFFTKEPFFALSASFVIRKELKNQFYDLIHLHSNILNYSFKNNFFLDTNKFKSKNYLNKLEIPIISTIHNTHQDSFNNIKVKKIFYFLGKFLHLPFVLLDKKRVNKSKIVTCVSTYTLKTVSKYSEDINKFIYLPNGVDTSIYKPINFDRVKFLKEKYNIHISNMKILLYIGRLELGKGINILLESLNYINNCILLVAGEGADKNLLKNNPKIKLLGYIYNQEEKNLILNSADLFVFASLYENFPSVICEAMASGLPILSSNVGMVGELLNNRKEVLTDPGNLNEFKEKLINVLKNNQFLENESTLNLEYAKKNLDWNKIAKKYIEQYNKLILK